MIETLSLIYVDVVTAACYQSYGPGLSVVRTTHRVLVFTPCSSGDLELVSRVVLTEVDDSLVNLILASEVEEILSIVNPAVV